ncbi:MAG: NAD(P)H-dependent oxidoreductase [archaeon]|nr:NAD(P)H-dependent oxidoreductase [archaeon]
MSESSPKLLFVNACVHRDRSRTDRLARALIDKVGPCSVKEVVLEDIDLPRVDTGYLDRRDRAIAEGDFSDPMFDMAKDILDADVIVLASPFWENTFNSFLKSYLECVSVPRLTYRYNESGFPEGACKAVLYYVTTRGGPVSDEEDNGYKAIEGTAFTWGIRKTFIVSASGLDIVGNDVEAILSDAVSKIELI